MTGRLVEEEIDGDVEIQLVEHTADEVVVRQRHLGVEADTKQAAHFAAIDLAENLVGIDARPGQLVRLDAPDLGDVGAMFRLGDVASAGELIALLTVLASALTVALAGDRRIAAAGPADAPRSENHVDRPEDVLDAVAVMLDAARVQQKARPAPCPTTPPPAGSTARRCPSFPPCAAASSRGHARRPCRSRWCVRR